MTTFYTNPRAGLAAQIAVRAHTHTHPDYEYWAPVWAKIRDAELGEIQVKAKAQKYLPKLAGHDAQQYASFLDRAVFYNMVAKTLNALYGSMFTRAAKVTGYQSKTFNKDGTSLNLTAKTAAKEVLTTGRFGMLVDAPSDGRGDPYVACYTAENIIDWETTFLDGKNRLSRVILQESQFDRSAGARAGDVVTQFRCLTLQPSSTGWRYTVDIFEDHTGSGIPDLKAAPATYVPTVRGRALDHIPFQFIGPFSNSPDIAKPPLLDIVTLNYSHYKSYAHLEQGRFYTANPVYTVSSGTADADSGEYYVGPDVVWELGKEGKASILEFNGQGLRSLENALTQKEAQIASIGGRMMPGGATGGPGESDAALKVRESNEQSLLLNVSDCLDEAFTQVLRWLADWSNQPTTGIEFEVSREFLTKTAGARELRAIHQMYAAGLIPLDVLFDFLRRADVVPDWLELGEFKDLLNDPAQFPNMVDVVAHIRGFPDAAAWHASRAKTGALV